MNTITKHFRRTLAAAVVLGTLGLAGQAGAVSLSVQYACMGDYFRYCSSHDPDGAGVRACMSRNGDKLSKGCVKALVGAGEISQAEVDRRASGARRASRRSRGVR